MASFIGHAVSAIGLGALFPPRRVPRRAWAVGAFCAAAPDLDAIGTFAGVPYGTLWGHRGITHSLPFALVFGTLVALACGRRFASPGWLACYLVLCTASHGLIDACTNGGIGIPLFAPFSNARYFFPWRPIQVSPIGFRGVLGARGRAILETEARWIGIPTAAALAAGTVFRKRRS